MRRIALCFVLLGFLFGSISCASAECDGEFMEFVTDQNHPGENKLLIEFEIDCDIDSKPALVGIYLEDNLVGRIVPEKQKSFRNSQAVLWKKFFMTTANMEIIEKLPFSSNLEIRFFNKHRQIINVVNYEVVTYDAIIGPMAYDCGAVTVWYDVTPMYGFNFQAVPWVDINIGDILQKTVTPRCQDNSCDLVVNFSPAEYEQIKGKHLKTSYTFPGGTAKSSYGQSSSCKPYEGT